MSATKCSDMEPDMEPELLPIEGDGPRRGNTAEKARLDVAGVGVWGAYERTFLDIMHPSCPTYVNKRIDSVLHENEKKNKYNERVLQIEGFIYANSRFYFWRSGV